VASQLQAQGAVRGRAKLCVLVWLCAAGVAAAQPAKANPEAEQHHQRGLRFLREEPKDFAQAAAEFAAAYEIDPRPRYLFNLALAQRLGGACGKAIASYRAYLETHPPEGYASDARVGIERCEKLAAAPPAPPPLDSKLADPSGISEPPPAGQLQPSTPGAAKPGAGASRGVEIAPRPWYRDRAGTSLIVAGGISAIAAAACYALARDAAGATFDPGSLDDYDSSRARAGALQTASWIAAGAAGALIAGGAIRYATRPAPRRAELAIRPAPSGIAMVLGGRF
jgi:tetratricopeptide (TPR) repeat protein